MAARWPGLIDGGSFYDDEHVDDDGIFPLKCSSKTALVLASLTIKYMETVSFTIDTDW